VRSTFLVVIGMLSLGSTLMCNDHNSGSLLSITHPGTASDVKLTVSVQGMRYCKGDNDVYTAHLRLALRYINAGSDKAILYKSKQPIEIVVGAIADNAKDIEEEHYETTLQYDQFIEPPRAPDSERPNASEFTILDPGSTHDLPGLVAVAVRFKPTSAIAGTIPPGDHAMTVEVVDWPFPPDDGRRLRIKWANIGTLHYEAIETPAFQFSIPTAPKLEECSDPK